MLSGDCFIFDRELKHCSPKNCFVAIRFTVLEIFDDFVAISSCCFKTSSDMFEIVNFFDFQNPINLYQSLLHV